jgi:hypothetical protein
MKRLSGERWVLAGEYVPIRESGPPSEDWVATLQIPDGTMTRLVRVPMKTPDGTTVLFPNVAYNESSNLLICATQESLGKDIYEDVWRYDLATGRSQWIAKSRWDNTRGFAWSPDGSKVAFVASTRGSPAAVVVQYDVHADKVEEVAGDAFGNLGGRQSFQEGDSVWRHRRPVYSEDGNCLYYVSMDRYVMRVDLRTKHVERLPFTNAIGVLTVKAEHVVYAREVTKGKDDRFEIVKMRLDAPDDSHAERVYVAGGLLNWNFASPSRRFILFTARAGYGCDVRVLDVERGTTWAGRGVYGGGAFTPHSTVSGGFAGP